MNLNPQTEGFINVTLQVLLASLWVAIPITILLILMYVYRKYKKWSDKETREADKILVKKNLDIVKTSDSINLLTARETELKLSVEKYLQMEQDLKKDLGIKEEEPAEAAAPVVDQKMNIKQLQALAKERGIKGCTRMSKEKLIEVLSKA